MEDRRGYLVFFIILGMLFSIFLVLGVFSPTPNQKIVEGRIEKIEYKQGGFSKSESYEIKINNTVYVIDTIQKDGIRLKENQTYRLKLEENVADERYKVLRIKKIN